MHTFDLDDINTIMNSVKRHESNLTPINLNESQNNKDFENDIYYDDFDGYWHWGNETFISDTAAYEAMQNSKGIYEDMNSDNELHQLVDTLENKVDEEGLSVELCNYKSSILDSYVISFRIEGDWKHDHLHFDYVIEEFFKDNPTFSLWKIDTEEVGDSDSDYYEAIHRIYVIHKEDLEKVQAMSKLFREDLNSSQLFTIYSYNDYLSEIFTGWPDADTDIDQYLKDLNKIAKALGTVANKLYIAVSYSDELPIESFVKEKSLGKDTFGSYLDLCSTSNIKFVFDNSRTYYFNNEDDANTFTEIISSQYNLEESLNEDYEEDEWIMVACKQVKDSDGFYTDYTWYENPSDEVSPKYIFIFGDNELYTPYNSEWDFDTDSRDEAQEWFDSYNGLIEEKYDKKKSNPKKPHLNKNAGDPQTGVSMFNSMNGFGNSSSGGSFSGGMGESLDTNKYWYFTLHGVQPGSVPNDIEIEEVKEGVDNKGMKGTFFTSNRVLSTKELNYYDCKELNPNCEDCEVFD